MKKIKNVSETIPKHLKDSTGSLKDEWKEKLVIKDKQHFKVCDCQKEKYDEILKEEIKQAYVELKESGDIDNEFVKNNRISRAVRDTYTKLLEYTTTNHIYCSNEFREIENVIDLFSQKYDLSDPRANMIVKVVLDNLLSTIRLGYSSNTHGSILEREDGLRLNPAEQARQKFNDSIVKAIEVLDKIFEGSKMVTVDFRAEMINAFKSRVEND